MPNDRASKKDTGALGFTGLNYCEKVLFMLLHWPKNCSRLQNTYKTKMLVL